ncbi:MAG: DUF3048 domain-containing protein [Nocardioidaceae bacterium]|nr:DUF3048 domain-containing protein [Nocardioidaceae bacterium]
MSKSHWIGGLRGAAPTVAVATLLLLTTACGGGNDATAADADGATDEQLRGAGTLTQISPLTGERTENGLPQRPVLAVKIDNTASSSPQLGLDSADLVAEELVEGGLTRLAAFFYSEVPGEVGPVRSMRASDIGILKPAEATLVASGGAPPTVRRLAGADVATITEDTRGAIGYTRDDSRVSPYNLMMRLDDLAETLEGAATGGVPAPYLPFGPADDFGSGQPAASIAATFSPGQTTRWSYQKGVGYVRPDGFAEQGHDFEADNVLVLRVEVVSAGYRDPAGNPVPETVFEGSGNAMLFHAGQLVTGTWHKDALGSGVRLESRNGEPLTVPAGRTWIELVPVKGGMVTYQK